MQAWRPEFNFQNPLKYDRSKPSPQSCLLTSTGMLAVANVSPSPTLRINKNVNEEW